MKMANQRSSITSLLKIQEAHQKIAAAAAEYSSDPDNEDFEDALPVDDLGSDSKTDTDSDLDAEMSNGKVSISQLGRDSH
jgi:hypothetical protein